jgi:uncharacterized membrane protein YkoI
MKRSAALLSVVVLAAAIQSMAAGLISKSTAEADALAAVGGGTVIQAVLDTNMGKKTWSVDILGTAHEYEVWVDAHTGAILNIITQPLAMPNSGLITKSQAEADALAAVGGGTVVQAQLEKDSGKKVWVVDINGTANEYEVTVDASSGAILKIVTHPLSSVNNCTYISKATAKADALAAVGGGTVLSAVLEKNDNPVDWSVDIAGSNSTDYEVKLNACNGAVISIITGH